MHLNTIGHLRTAHGKIIGRIERIVVDPATGGVTHLVVKNGRMPGRDRKVVPVDALETPTPGRDRLTARVAGIEAFPTFDRTRYVPVGGVEDFQRQASRKAAWMAWFHTRPHNPWWQAESSAPPERPLFARKKRRGIPDGTVPLAEGAVVADSLGKRVGDVTEVGLDPSDGRMTHVSVSCGWFTKGHKRIPMRWVRRLSERGVRLNVEKASIESLPCGSPSDNT